MGRLTERFDTLAVGEEIASGSPFPGMDATEIVWEVLKANPDKNVAKVRGTYHGIYLGEWYVKRSESGKLLWVSPRPSSKVVEV